MAIILGAIVALGTWIGTRFDPLGGAHAAYARHDYRSALLAARDHLESFPADSNAALMAARCLARLGRNNETEPYYQKAGALSIDDMQDRAIALIQSNQPQAAAVVYDQILQRNPAEVLALKRLAAVRMGLKQWRAVVNVANQLVALPSEQVAGQTMVAIAQHELKHYEQSVNAHLRVLSLDPDLERMPLPKTLFWNNLAMDLIALGRDDEARRHLTHAVATAPDASLMELIGLTYSQQGALDEAERWWRRAESLDPNNADICLDLGRLAIARQRWDEAVSFLKRAAEQSSDAVEPLYSLSQAYRMKGNAAQAEHYKRLADERRKASPPAPRGMGVDTEVRSDKNDETKPVPARDSSR